MNPVNNGVFYGNEKIKYQHQEGTSQAESGGFGGAGKIRRGEGEATGGKTETENDAGEVKYENRERSTEACGRSPD